jgi:hypothetical protein
VIASAEDSSLVKLF